MIKAILFDYFGVISTDEYWGFVGEAKKDYAEFHKLADKVNLGRITWRDFLQEVAQSSDKSTKKVERMYAKHKLNWPLIKLIRELKPHYSMGLATNAYAAYIKPLLKKSALNKVFEHIYISSEVGVLKSNPGFFKYVLNELSLRPEQCLMIDDQEINLEGAHLAGLKTIFYKNFDQLQGELLNLGVG